MSTDTIGYVPSTFGCLCCHRRTLTCLFLSQSYHFKDPSEVVEMLQQRSARKQDEDEDEEFEVYVSELCGARLLVIDKGHAEGILQHLASRKPKMLLDKSCGLSIENQEIGVHLKVPDTE